MTEIKVSVIVPVYNSVKYINKCVDSLLSQTLEEIEIILVNDASTDKSLDILRDYERQFPEKVKVIDSKINRRQGGARNLGIEVAKGEYIAFLDSDDYVSVQAYQLMYDKAISTASDIVECQYFEVVGNQEYKKEYRTEAMDLLTEEKKKYLFLNPNFGPIWTKIYKRELLIDNNLRFVEHAVYEDIVFTPLVMMYAKKVELVNLPLYYYVRHEGTTTTSKKPFSEERYKSAQFFKGQSEVRGFSNQYKEEYEYNFVHFGYAGLIWPVLNSSVEIKKQYLPIMREIMRKDFPFYRKNKYFKKISRLNKIVTKLNDISPSLLILLYKLAKGK